MMIVPRWDKVLEWKGGGSDDNCNLKIRYNALQEGGPLYNMYICAIYAGICELKCTS